MPSNLPSVFLDTNIILAGIRSATGGSRVILRLGEANQVNLWVSQDVLAEVDDNIRKVAPNQVLNVAALLEVSGIEIVDPPDIMTVQMCQQFLNYADDAVVLAAAITAQVDYFVTLDRQHILGNPLMPSSIQLPIGSPSDFLVWFRGRMNR